MAVLIRKRISDLSEKEDEVPQWNINHKLLRGLISYSHPTST